MNAEEIRKIAKQAIDGQVVVGKESAKVLELMTGPEAWKLGVAIALEYVERYQMELAHAVLTDMLEDEGVDNS